MKEKTYKHPSYGQISLSESCGGLRSLYGSSIKHQNTIRMEIHHSKHDRDLNNDWYHKTDPIIKIELSPTQFTELIINKRNYGGVPCTIMYTENDGDIQRPELKSKVEEFENEFEESMKEISQLIVKYKQRCK